MMKIDKLKNINVFCGEKCYVIGDNETHTISTTQGNTVFTPVVIDRTFFRTTLILFNDHNVVGEYDSGKKFAYIKLVRQLSPASAFSLLNAKNAVECCAAMSHEQIADLCLYVY